MRSTVRVQDNVVVREWCNGAVVRTFQAHNTWGTAGLNAIRNWFAGQGGTPVTHIAWVDENGVEGARDIVTQRVLLGDGTFLIRQYLPSVTSANGRTLTTLRAYNAQSGGTQFAEVVYDAVGIAKTANNQITADWTHVFADGGT
ncbi:MAG: hypothetical protein WC343_08740 [Bacilli bacterium]|jgi:hypothetical protein